jgi:N-acetylmuramoyl-L-alanine amidase
MATSTAKPLFASPRALAASVRAWPLAGKSSPARDTGSAGDDASPLDALQALLAFSVLHEQARRKKLDAAENPESSPSAEFDKGEQFVLDEILQLVAERAVAITGADGVAIALAENDEVVLRAAAGTVRPDLGARIDRDSGFSGACFREAQIVCCDDAEIDPQVNAEACRRLGVRSLVAVPLYGRRRVIGVVEAFSTWPFAFNHNDIQNLSLLAELVVGALRPEDENRFAASARVAATHLEVRAAVPIEEPVHDPVEADSLARKPEPPDSTAADPPHRSEPNPIEECPQELLPVSLATLRNPDSIVAVSEAAPELVAINSADEAPVASGAFAPAARSVWRWSALGLLLVLIMAGMWWRVRNGEKSAGAAGVPTASSQPAKDNGSTFFRPDSSLRHSPPISTVRSLPEGFAGFPIVTAVDPVSSADTMVVTISLEQPVQYEEHRLVHPDRIYFDLKQTQLAAGLNGKTIVLEDALIKRIRVAQPVTGVTRVVIDNGPGTALAPRVHMDSAPCRLVIELHKPGATAAPALSSPAPGSGTDQQKPEPQKTQNEKMHASRGSDPTSASFHARLRIAVDAGHGGWDLGTVGRDGLLEKDLVLDVARRLADRLSSELGAEIIFTRNRDDYVSLEARAAIANRANADLLISIHANYSERASARGVETYYATTYSAIANESKVTVLSAPMRGVSASVPLKPAELEQRAARARELAASVQSTLYEQLSAENPGLPDRGFKTGDFTVLEASTMPAVLTEISFVSSPTDERKLKAEAYRAQIAAALFQGIARYLARSRSKDGQPLALNLAT